MTKTVGPYDLPTACDFLAACTSLSKSRIKDAMIKGAVWLKPTGLMSQGTKYGDHCSLLRQVKLFYKSKSNAYLIQRLDREASGLVLLAHDRLAADRLSRLFQTRQVIKKYKARVLGKIDLELEGKAKEWYLNMLADNCFAFCVAF